MTNLIAQINDEFKAELELIENARFENIEIYIDQDSNDGETICIESDYNIELRTAILKNDITEFLTSLNVEFKDGYELSVRAR